MQFEELSDILKKSGVVGAGGAGFPSYAKLNKKADTVILNCAECEPLFRMHRQLLAKYTYEILIALETVREAMGAEKIIVAVKPSYTDAIDSVKSWLKSFPKVSIHILPDIYPAGDEVITIYESTGRVVPPGAIPISVGVVVYNVETMLNAYYAIKAKKPVVSKYVTVAGTVKNPTTYCVPLGMRFSELVDLAGGVTEGDVQYLNGGAMTGNLSSPVDVVTKTTNAVLILPSNHQAVLKRKANVEISVKRAMSSCCQCRMCTDLCPRNLLGHPVEPHAFMRAVAKGADKDISAVLNTSYCVSCGVCEMFSCPQGLSPRTLLTNCKKKLKENAVELPPPILEPVSEKREYRKVPMKRLLARLGLIPYMSKAPLIEDELKPETVKIKLSQHIGKPATAVVRVGDKVKIGDLIGTTEGALGSDIHCSLDGIVIDVNNEFVVIKR